jgi:hypothetical protein
VPVSVDHRVVKMTPNVRSRTIHLF